MVKKLFSVFAAMVCIFGFTGALFAGGGSGSGPGAQTDSLRTAQVFGGLDIRSYEGSANFRRGGTDEWIGMDFKMTADGRVPYLKIGETVVVVEGVDEPLPGLPVNKIGETRDFSLNLWTAGPDPAAHGYFYSQLLLPGDPIVIWLEANYVRQFVAFPFITPPGTQNMLTLRASRETTEYNVSAQGFYVWVDPTRTTEYAIVDRATNVLYQRGTINPLEGTAMPTSHLVTIKLPVGIEQVPDSGYESFNYQKLDGFVDGTAAKVYIWDLKKSGGSIEVYGLTGGNVVVKRWTALGEMPNATVTSDGNYTKVEAGYDKVIIIVTGATDESFSIYFNRWDGNGGRG